VTFEVTPPPTALEESPPDMESPQVTTEPLDFMAAKAHCVEEIDFTPEVRCPPTGLEESPPTKAPPQVTTEAVGFQGREGI
jgi:hypothetical protein